MPKRPVAVLGGGNGAHMMAADLTDRGYRVHMYEHPQFATGFRTTLQRRAIEVEGIGLQGTIPIDRVSTDIANTLEDVEWIHVVIAATGHELFFQELVPHLQERHKVVLWAGDFGSLRLHALLKDRAPHGVTIIECSTIPYGTRLTGPGRVALLLLAPRVMAASIPAADLATVIDGFREMFPCVVAGDNVLAAAFNNPNPIVHPPGALLNTGRIEYSGGDFYMYGEGITEAVARVVREIYEESRRVANALGFDMIRYRDTDFTTKTSIMGVEFVAPFDTQGVIASILGPTSLKDRYITEDLPQGLVPRSELGRVVDVPTPVIDGVVSIGSVVCQEDYWKTGRTLERLGLSGLSRDEIMQVVETG
jgi:opine dehydrogenase